jgi:hypothetical protein
MTTLTNLPPIGPLWSIQADGTAVLGGNDAPVPVPSGQNVTLQDVIWNVPGPDGLTLRFRFIAPGIARESGEVDFETAVADMMALCQGFALPRLSEFGPTPAQVIISMSDVPVAFGEAAPDATQFFEAFTIKDGTCVWEVY